MAIMLSVNSSIDLKLEGTVGSFEVGSGNNHDSLNVKYFLTHVGLNFTSGSDEKLLRELAPVREIFSPEDLDFDEIMQRDIDDSRVSNELIPYILDDKTNDLIKFFPPIVVIALPISNNRNKPEAYYPKVFCEEVEKEESGVEKWLVTRSGEIGSEVFEFKQPIINNKPDNHNLVTLGLNTSKCRMIIVDGQHRAMSLLALYRNIKDQWSDAKRQPFKKYYEEWTPNYIREFDLKNINLPLIICTIPSLDEEYSASDYNLKKAARSIFLTLNKTARKVSRTRNLLLDDNNLISSFMRKTLGEIKNNDDIRGTSLSIQNIELDQDRQKISTPIAISGVSHIYYIIERLLLDSGDIIGVSPRSGRFGGRKTFSEALERLDCKNMLGQNSYTETKRNSFTDEVETSLKNKYQKIYGNIIIKFLTEFYPYDIHNRSSLELLVTLKRRDPDLVSMLFEGQGIINIFEEHRANLKKKLKEKYFDTDVPKIEAIVKELDNTDMRLKSRIESFYRNRTEKYISNCSDKGKFKKNNEISDIINTEIKKLYDNIYTSVAFQSAVICGFFKIYEKTSDNFQGSSNIDLNDSFDEYLGQINSFFNPISFSSFKKIISVLSGRAEGSSSKKLKISYKSNDSFRGVVFPGEMNPDHWPKYRYLLLEIWKPTFKSLKREAEEELNICRKQVFIDLYNRNKKLFIQRKNTTEDLLKEKDLDNIFSDSFSEFSSFLKHFNQSSSLSRSKFNKYITN